MAADTVHRPSVDERLRREIADQGTVVTSLQRRCLHHQYGYQLLFGINPKGRIGMAIVDQINTDMVLRSVAALGAPASRRFD
jgi:hypothetical protein